MPTKYNEPLIDHWVKIFYLLPHVWQAAMLRKQNILLVSSQDEHRRDVTSVLQRFPVEVAAACDLRQAKQVLANPGVDIIFCDEDFPDGTYRDLLCASSARQYPPKVVVITRTGEWLECLEAMRLGAFDVIPAPVSAEAVDLVLRHASRDQQPVTGRVSALG